MPLDTRLDVRLGLGLGVEGSIPNCVKPKQCDFIDQRHVT